MGHRQANDGSRWWNSATPGGQDAGAPEDDGSELRECSDGRKYTKKDFLEWFGPGLAEKKWREATPAGAPQPGGQDAGAPPSRAGRLRVEMNGVCGPLCSTEVSLTKDFRVRDLKLRLEFLAGISRERQVLIVGLDEVHDYMLLQDLVTSTEDVLTLTVVRGRPKFAWRCGLAGR